MLGKNGGKVKSKKAKVKRQKFGLSSSLLPFYFLLFRFACKFILIELD